MRIDLDNIPINVCTIYFFFFKQKTAYEIYQCDWSSDVCSSDLRTVSPWRRKKGTMPNTGNLQRNGSVFRYSATTGASQMRNHPEEKTGNEAIRRPETYERAYH